MCTQLYSPSETGSHRDLYWNTNSRTLSGRNPFLKEKKGFCAHVVAAPLAEVEGPVARSQGPRAEAKATRARGLANPAEDSIRQARFKTEMRACAGRQRSARRTYEGAEGEDDIITESSEEKRDRKRCPAPGRSRAPPGQLSLLTS